MYITYKITNLITNEYYFGSHKTDNIKDSYMGSGKKIKQSIEKYGLNAHKKEILGIYDNRKQSIKLEHDFIKQYRYDKLLLNINSGGFSFDYINENLSFDRASFAKKAVHKYRRELSEKLQEEYNKNPKICITCGNIIPYQKRNNKFCCSSCAAIYNNKQRNKVGKCLFCGKEFIILSRRKKYCSKDCADMAFKKNSAKFTKSEVLDIIKRHNEGESYKKIAKNLNVSTYYIFQLCTGKCMNFR